MPVRLPGVRRRAIVLMDASTPRRAEGRRAGHQGDRALLGYFWVAPSHAHPHLLGSSLPVHTRVRDRRRVPAVAATAGSSSPSRAFVAVGVELVRTRPQRRPLGQAPPRAHP
jgi:hypothetical protein